MATMTTAGQVKAGDHITVPGVLLPEPLLVEHVWVSDADTHFATANITLWPKHALRNANHDERTTMVTLLLVVPTLIVKFSESDLTYLTTRQSVFGLVDSVRAGSTSTAGAVKRVIRFHDGREFTTATNSSSGYDAANLHGGDAVLLSLNTTGQVVAVHTPG